MGTRAVGTAYRRGATVAGGRGLRSRLPPATVGFGQGPPRRREWLYRGPVSVGELEQAVPQAGRPVQRADRLRWLLLPACLVLVLLTVTTGVRSSSFGSLLSALDDGRVHAVQVTPGLGPDTSGCSVQQIRWREGLWQHRTEVVVHTPGDASSCDGSTAVHAKDVVPQLRQVQPGLHVERVGYDLRGGFSIFGWHTPQWVGLAALGWWFAAVTLLAAGPAPWRATRWAWFWVMTNPLGVVAFALLAGPTPPLAPHARARPWTHRRVGVPADLARLLLRPEAELTLTDLARELGIASSTLHPEVQRLVAAHVLRSRSVGRSRLISANTDNPIVGPLTELLALTFGVEPVLRDVLDQVSGVELALIYGSWAARVAGEQGAPPADVDVLVVGHPSRSAVYQAAEDAEARLGRPVNPVVRSAKTWHGDGDPLVREIKRSPRVVLVDREGEMP